MNRPLSTTGTAALLEQLSGLVPDDLINRPLRAPALQGRRPAEPLPADPAAPATAVGLGR